MSRAKGQNERTIVIKRFEIVEGGHHGGSWKIAYADFVTAMMAFFLVMWLINATTEEQRKGIASYFNPMALQKDTPPPAENVVTVSPQPVAASVSPAAVHPGDPKGPYADNGPSGKAHLTAQDRGERSTQVVVLHDKEADPGEVPREEGAKSGDASRSGLRSVAKDIRDAVNSSTQFQDIRSQVSVQVGDDGLHIEIADSEHQPMFASGSAVPTRHAAELLSMVVPYLEKLSGRLSISGYTDATPYRAGTPSNWSLSSERAVAARDILIRSGFPDWRLKSVSGYADRALFDPSHPLSAANRRVVLVLSPDRF